MQVIKDTKSLAEAIALLENIHASEGTLLKEHFQFTVSSLNPMNIIKDKISDTFSSPIFKNEIVKGSLGIATGLLSNSLIVGASGGLLNKVVASLVQTGISKVTSTNTEAIKDSGISFLKNVLTKMKIKS
ncbi:hypothetical protein [Flavobacterium sp.]|uniref:hypothetical protein n=1 Tax=Flavobacterium sp. TaxID=239 RepID=UPI002B4ADB29|nr:hypothetical protein [Flavobacterium sp.]HLF51837.1 hypothetical protein [Flavobacterium sp.]